MKRIILMVTVALVMAAMMAVTAIPALAAVHPLARMECANQAQASDVVVNQDPVGLVGQSQGKPPNNPIGGNIAQPIFAVAGNDTAASNAFKDDVCPAP